MRDFGALLIDEQYSVRGDRRRDEGRTSTVGTPAEKAGAIPLAWASEPFSASLTGAFVKVLARYRPDDDPAVQAEQWAKLEALQAWCRGAGKPLVLEVLVARTHEAEDEFEASGRPAMLAGFIAEAYRRGLTPEFWKIEGTLVAGRARARSTRRSRQTRRAGRSSWARPPTSRPSIAGSRRAPPAPPPPASPSAARSSGSRRRRFSPGTMTADERRRRHRRHLPDAGRRLERSRKSDVLTICKSELRMGNLLGDFRYALRSLARQPTFACVAILTLVLGIGTNTAIFSVIKAVLLNQLPYQDASRLVVLCASRTPTAAWIWWRR